MKGLKLLSIWLLIGWIAYSNSIKFNFRTKRMLYMQAGHVNNDPLNDFNDTDAVDSSTHAVDANVQLHHNNSIEEAVTIENHDEDLLIISPETVLSVQSLRYKLETTSPPLLDFRHDVDRLLSAGADSVDVIPASEFEIENLVNQYLSILRDMYYVQFAQLCANSGHRYNQCHQYMNSTIRECTAAMAAALPSPTPHGRVWSYQGHLAELEADLARHLAEIVAINEAKGIPVDGIEEEQLHSMWRDIKASKWFKRCKWVAVQSLVLAVNIGQFELQRLIARRAAEKRLAAVPEFPLL